MTNVTLEILSVLPAKDLYPVGLVDTALRQDRTAPRSAAPDWDMKDLTGTESPQVAMNSCGRTTFENQDYLSTANLYGCLAIAGVFRPDDKGWTIEAFLEHYDALTAREVDEESGRLKMSGLVRQFSCHAGRRAVQLAFAYPQRLVRDPAQKEHAPDDFLIEHITKDFQEALPDGSRVLLVPYPMPMHTPEQLEAGTVGNVLSVGLGGSFMPDFRWNSKHIGHTAAGQGEPPMAARAYAAMRYDDYDHMDC